MRHRLEAQASSRGDSFCAIRDPVVGSIRLYSSLVERVQRGQIDADGSA
jgi:hypothetical protein